MKSEPQLLTDEQMRQFIAEGFLILKTDLSKEFHQKLLEQLNAVYQNEGNPGNNLLPRIREVQKVFEHPVITGALTSVLGPGYMLHAHRHGHYNSSPQPGGWHKDSYWGYKKMRNHHPWWAMIMYFPQDTPVELGPTGVLPGSQYYDTRTFQDENPSAEATANGEAGTFALIQYDIWHRSTANQLGQHRYMLKFEFMRTQIPEAPSWDHRGQEWITPSSLNPAVRPHEVIWRDTWNWLSGRLGPDTVAADSPEAVDAQPWLDQLQHADPELRVAAANRLGLWGEAAGEAGAVPALARALEDAFEPVRLNAAYGLARMGEQGISALLQALQHEKKAISRTAAYGLSAAGDGAVAGLAAALESQRDEIAVHAAFALGELRQLAAPAVPALIKLLAHSSEPVRYTVVEALCNIGTPHEEIITALKRALNDADTQVRFMTGLCISRLGAQAEQAVPELVQALEDDNRYVRAHAADALYYIGTDKAKDALLQFLRQSRWCPTTTAASTFYP
ncbi:HEAT repeat domain-containing protein [Paenibacillus sp. J2TS4]|uniref:HEAT repeat domain-containing protein n=1 Tax=Paenibacillus sp. J2TS4 TaxID=2807194 RepID=UPI001B01B71A|nr:HEAT repeat domain-containing protein [Paenibacillus sp. J2TS4]GIP33208.1 hypothetical protein J2TS4_24180 [Paenibacillus sp. J2TS4]